MDTGRFSLNPPGFWRRAHGPGLQALLQDLGHHGSYPVYDKLDPDNHRQQAHKSGHHVDSGLAQPPEDAGSDREDGPADQHYRENGHVYRAHLPLIVSLGGKGDNRRDRSGPGKDGNSERHYAYFALAFGFPSLRDAGSLARDFRLDHVGADLEKENSARDPERVCGDPKKLEDRSAKQPENDEHDDSRRDGQPQRGCAMLCLVALGRCDIKRDRTQRIDDREQR